MRHMCPIIVISNHYAIYSFELFYAEIDPSHKSHNTSYKYPKIYHCVTEMCTHAHISVTKWCILGFVQQVYNHDAHSF